MSKGTGVSILAGLMVFSVITSSLHLGFQVLGGYQSSISESTEYQIALADYELAAKAYSEVLASAAKADEEGDTRSGGWIRKSYAPPLKKDVDSARSRLESAKQSAGTEASVLAQVAGFFDMAPERFSALFALFSVLLMEVCRIWLAFSTASAIRQLIKGAPQGKKLQPELRAVA